jgi:hypothetical protein
VLWLERPVYFIEAQRTSPVYHSPIHERQIFKGIQMDYNIQYVSSEESTKLGKRVEAFHYSEEEIGKPEDVNALVALFPRVSIRTGYILDYHIDDDAERSVASWITPFVRRPDDPSPERFAGFDPIPFERESLGYTPEEAHEQAAIKRLYRYLDYEQSPEGLFEYAFAMLELTSWRAGGHAGEWSDSTPVFCEEDFKSYLHEASDVPAYPDHYGPEVRLEKRGGIVEFMVASPIGTARIYTLWVQVKENGSFDCRSGRAWCDDLKMGGIVY